ncbi:MAG: anti-sigma factor [Actinomycetota bacterium]
MIHDPEKNAVAYLGGAMSHRRRNAFEAHMLECEDCWREVELGREGRALAESAREVAPQRLREFVRASVATVSPSPRRWGWKLGLGLAITAAVLVPLIWVAVRPEPQPRGIDAVMANFERSADLDPAARELPNRLGDMRLRSSEAGRLGDLQVVAHRYGDEAGHVVVVYQSRESFPVAVGADHNGATWTATLDGTHLFCADIPVPSLVVGDDRMEVAMVVEKLGLR